MRFLEEKFWEDAVVKILEKNVKKKSSRASSR
jgi:hypothetical protein